jgi:hypothetical protein
MVERGDDLQVTDGGPTLPAADVLTGRGFVTGKSGSGKSNTASVLVEELLDRDSRLLVVDTDGEYYGLKEEYEVLHLGADGDRCDAVVGPGDADAVADLALAEGVPVVLDVSGFLESDEADRLVYEVAKELFSRARDVRQPFLLLVEEVHEFVPQQGGLGEVGEMLVRVAKRGRKRGLGLCGLSQRPASVDKDFITQCDWLVWHRLTWANDTKVAARILGDEYADRVEGLDDGEAFLLADWNEDVQRVQFRRKRTFDAGATPGFGAGEVPELRPVDAAWLERFGGSPSAESTKAESGSHESAEGGAESDGPDDGSGDASDGGDGGTTADGDDSRSGATAGGRGGGGGGAQARTTSPAADGKAVVWELGQLVTHLAGAVARGTASGLARLGRLGARKTRAGVRGVGPTVERADDAVRALGFRTRAGWSRLRDAAVGDGASFPQTAGADRGGRQWGTVPANPTADRVLGLTVLLAVALFAVAAYAFLRGGRT